MARRYNVQLTPAQHEAVLEALAFRIAAPLEGTTQRPETYEAAERAVIRARLSNVRDPQS